MEIGLALAVGCIYVIVLASFYLGIEIDNGAEKSA